MRAHGHYGITILASRRCFAFGLGIAILCALGPTNVWAAPIPYVFLEANAGVASGGVNTPVTSWTDQSSNGFVFTTPTFGSPQKPTLVNGPNGTLAVNFSSTQMMASVSAIPLFTSASSGLTVFTVMKPNVTTDGNQHFVLTDASTIGGGKSFELGVNAGQANLPGSWGVHRGSSQVTGTGSNVLTAGSWVIMATQVLTTGNAPNNIAFYENGTLLTSFASGGGWLNAGQYPTSPVVQLDLGARIDNKSGVLNPSISPDSFFNGSIAAVIVYQGALSDADRNLVTFQLGQQFGIATSVPPPPPPQIPEPSSLALLTLGGVALAGWRRWRKRQATA